MAKPDIQQVVGGLAQCIVMQERWAAGCLYLHDEGDLGCCSRGDGSIRYVAGSGGEDRRIQQNRKL